MRLRRANNSYEHSEVSGLQRLPARFTRWMASTQLECVITLCVAMACKVNINFGLKRSMLNQEYIPGGDEQHEISDEPVFNETANAKPANRSSLSLQERFT